jgi:hypothetical protein
MTHINAILSWICNFIVAIPVYMMLKYHILSKKNASHHWLVVAIATIAIVIIVNTKTNPFNFLWMILSIAISAILCFKKYCLDQEGGLYEKNN